MTNKDTGAGKGDKRRPGNEQAYRYNYESIFGFSGVCECCLTFKKLKIVRTNTNALVELCSTCRKEYELYDTNN